MKSNPLLINMPLPINTERLMIRHYLPGDGLESNNAIKESYSELTKWMPWAEKIPTVSESETFARMAHGKFILREDCTFPIFDSSGRRQIGGTGFHRIKWDIPSVEIGYWVRTSESGKGYISEAVNALTRYAFQVLSAKRVEIHCDAENTKSANIPRKLGFHLEGCLKNQGHKCHNGGLGDTLIFARIDEAGLPELNVNW